VCVTESMCVREKVCVSQKLCVSDRKCVCHRKYVCLKVCVTEKYDFLFGLASNAVAFRMTDLTDQKRSLIQRTLALAFTTFQKHPYVAAVQGL
jgi:hypothetical protein